MNFIDTKEVIALVKVSRNALLDLIAHQDFPKPILLGKRKRRWREGDVIAWMAAR